MATRKSRPQRWQEAVTAARQAADKVTTAAEELATALQGLADLRSEYEEWRDNLPESLQSSPLGEKLNAVCDELDFDSMTDADGVLNDWQAVTDTIDNAESIDLPRGFGKD